MRSDFSLNTFTTLNEYLPGIFPHSCPTNGERLIRGYTKFDFTVDEGKGRLNPSHDKNEGKHCRRKAEKSFVALIRCDPG